MKLVAQAGHVAGHRAVAEADHDLAARADLLGQLQVVHVGHCAFHQRHVHVLGKLLDVGDGAVDQLHRLGQVDQLLVQVQEAHVAAGAAAQPGCGQPDLAACSAAGLGSPWRPFFFEASVVIVSACLVPIHRCASPTVSSRGRPGSSAGSRGASPSRPRWSPCWCSAPVGQTCTHLPQLVQLSWCPRAGSGR